LNKSKQVQAYQDNAVVTASGPQLTLMLYNGCIKFINQGIKALEKNAYEQKNTYIQKAQQVIQELMLTLNPDIKLSQDLILLYDFILHQLQQANIKNDEKLLLEALEFVTDFRDTWKEAMVSAVKTSKIESVQV